MPEHSSQSLLNRGSRPAVRQPAQAYSGPPVIVSTKDDYLFKNDSVQSNSGIRNDEERIKHEVSWRFNFNKDVSGNRFSRRIEESKLIFPYLERANERMKRHYTLEGDVLVHYKIKNDWPKLQFCSMLVPLDLKEKVPDISEKVFGDDEISLEVVFRPLTVKLRRKFEPYIFDIKNVENDVKEMRFDYVEYYRLVFMSCFKSWNIPVELEKNDEGFLTERGRESFSLLHPKLIECLASDFVELNEIRDEEIEVLEKQCDVLFKKDSEGVQNAVEGIKLYCEASVFSKEFALSKSELDNVPYRAAELIRRVANKNGEEIKRQFNEDQKKYEKNAPKKRKR